MRNDNKCAVPTCIKNMGRKSFKYSENRSESYSEKGGGGEKPIKTKFRFQMNATATSGSYEYDAGKNGNAPRLPSVTDIQILHSRSSEQPILLLLSIADICNISACVGGLKDGRHLRTSVMFCSVSSQTENPNYSVLNWDQLFLSLSGSHPIKSKFIFTFLDLLNAL